MSEELKRCPFCGRKPTVLQRPDSMDGYFCAVSCFCGGYAARAHQGATDEVNAEEAYRKAAERWNRRAEPDMGITITETNRLEIHTVKNDHIPAAGYMINAPLALDELRGMDEKAVWVQFDGIGMFALVAYHADEEDGDEVYFTNNIGGRNTLDEVLKQGGKAYRRKP